MCQQNNTPGKSVGDGGKWGKRWTSFPDIIKSRFSLVDLKRSCWGREARAELISGKEVMKCGKVKDIDEEDACFIVISCRR